MSSVMDTMKLGGLVRMAVKLVRGCEIKLLPANPTSGHLPSTAGLGLDSSSCLVGGLKGEFQLTVFSAIKWFKVRERYELSGKPGSFRRVRGLKSTSPKS